MENTKQSNFWIWILIGVILLGWFKYDRLKEDNLQLRSEITDYEYALEEANNNIEEANSYIEDAQGYAWSSYQEMGEALDNLMTVETVSDVGGLKFNFGWQKIQGISPLKFNFTR